MSAFVTALTGIAVPVLGVVGLLVLVCVCAGEVRR